MNIVLLKKLLITICDLRKIATSEEIIESLINELDEDEYCYIYRWFLILK